MVLDFVYKREDMQRFWNSPSERDARTKALLLDMGLLSVVGTNSTHNELHSIKFTFGMAGTSGIAQAYSSHY